MSSCLCALVVIIRTVDEPVRFLAASILTLTLLLVSLFTGGGVTASPSPVTLVFVGDVMLGRGGGAPLGGGGGGALWYKRATGGGAAGAVSASGKPRAPEPVGWDAPVTGHALGAAGCLARA